MAEKTKETATDDGVLAKCGSCSSEQPLSHKCCAECGATMAKAARSEYDSALADLGAFHKAALELPEQPEVTRGEHGEADKVLLKARSVEGVDAAELATVELLIGGQTVNSDQLVTILGDVRAGRRDIGTVAGLMAKAISAGFKAHEEAYTSAIAALTKRVEEWEGQPGRSRSAQLEPLTKSLHRPAGDENDDTLRGEPLIKAVIAAGGARKLDETDVTEVQHWAQRNYSLGAIVKEFPALGARVTAAITPAH